MPQGPEDLPLLVGDDSDAGIIDDHVDDREQEQGDEEMEVRKDERQPFRDRGFRQGCEQGRDELQDQAQRQDEEDQGNEKQADEPPEIAAAVASESVEARGALPVEEAADDAAVEEDVKPQVGDAAGHEAGGDGRQGVLVLENGLSDPHQVDRPDARPEQGLTELRLDEGQERERDDEGEEEVDGIEDDQEAGLAESRPDAVDDGFEGAHGSLLSSTIRRSGGRTEW